MRKSHILFWLTIVIGALLRILGIDSIPPGIHADEADLGYAAYSILHTGLSAYGTFNPLAFPEFNGGTHPPLYTLILVFLTKLFGMSIVVQRLPSIIFGVATVPVMYLLIKRLFGSKNTALVGAALFAINPWSIFISRQGLHESIAVFFVTCGILFFLLAKTKHVFYILSAICFGLSLHSYDAPKIFVPIFILVLIVYQWKFIMKAKKYVVASLLIFLFFSILLLKTLFLDGQISDFNRISSFDKSEISNAVNYERRMTTAPLWLSSIFHNKVTVIYKKYTSSFFRPFSTSWFFVDGHQNLLEAVGKQGQYYFFEMPFFFIGLLLAFRKDKKLGALLLGWLLIGNIPGAITKGDFYPYRSVLILPVPIIFSSLVIITFVQWVSKVTRFRLLALGSIALICAFYVLSFLFTYFYDYPIYASEWRYKQRNEVLLYVEGIQSKYTYVFVNGDVEWAVMYAYLSKTDPRLFQKAYKNKQDYKGVEAIHIKKFYFASFNAIKIATPSAFFPQNSLVVVDAGMFKDVQSLKTFHGADPLNIIYKVLEIK